MFSQEDVPTGASSAMMTVVVFDLVSFGEHEYLVNTGFHSIDFSGVWVRSWFQFRVVRGICPALADIIQ